jgi:DNA-binding response OmpR family regulator
MNLLIVEDEVLLNEKYSEYLSHEFEVTSTFSYAEAKEALNENSYDVILFDYNLNDGKGLDLVKELGLEALSQGFKPVLVLVTAYSKEKLAIESLNLGVFRYLEKPMTRENLVTQMLAAKEEARKRHGHAALAQQFLLGEKAKKIFKNDYFISERELEVIEALLVHGKNKTVAEKTLY